MGSSLERGTREMKQMLIAPETRLEKFSDIWDWADKNLIQYIGGFGDATTKRVCAVGAIAYYFSNGESVVPSFFSIEEDRNIWEKIEQISKKLKWWIPTLNDRGVTFKELAKMSRAVGF